MLALCLLGALVLGGFAWFHVKPLMQAEGVYTGLRRAYFDEGAASPDWAALQARYPDIVGWLSAPDIGVDYPVVQGGDNSYYLSHLPDGAYNAVGSVFMDAENTPDLTDPLTVLYGHHVGGGKMFSPLVNYRKGEFYAQHPTMTYYTSEKEYIVEIFAAHEADGQEGAFLWEYAGADEAGQAEWLARLAARSDVAGRAAPQAGDRLLALVTCSSLGENAPRYIVYGVLREAAAATGGAHENG